MTLRIESWQDDAEAWSLSFFDAEAAPGSPRVASALVDTLDERGRPWVRYFVYHPEVTDQALRVAFEQWCALVTTGTEAVAS